MQRIHLLFAFLATMSAWSQGIQINCGYPHDSCYRQLTIEDIDTSSHLLTFTGSDAYTLFKDQGLWNQPAAYRTGITGETSFNYFATLVPNAFIPIYKREYRMLIGKDEKPAYIENSWLKKDEGIFNGKNQITYVNFGNKTYSLNQNEPIWVVKTEQQFYREYCRGRTYDDLLKLVAKEDIGAQEKNILNELYGEKDAFKSSFKDNFEATFKVHFDSASHSIDSTYGSSISPNNQELYRLKNDLYQSIDRWAKTNYLISNSGSNYRIPIDKAFKIEIINVTTFQPKKNEFAKNFHLTFPLTNDKISTIKKTFKIPYDVKYSFHETMCYARVNGFSQKIDSTRKLGSIDYLPTINWKDCKAIVGLAHTSIRRNPKIIIPIVTIAGGLSTGVAWMVRDIAYKQYLKTPQDRPNAYTTANFANKIILAGAGLWAVGITCDLVTTRNNRIRLNRQLQNLDKNP
ncbi:MAG: hypothetical protein RL110_928 [Bacteroidota bacterium]|jgi:hypothetical protein